MPRAASIRQAEGPYRLLREPEAARYVGVSPTKLRELVQAKRLPEPHRIDGCVVWDIRELDPAIDALLYGIEPSAPAGVGRVSSWA